MPKSAPDWYTSVSISGKHLINLIPVAVDADGNMLGIMQGEGPGGLDTVALDVGGRLITVIRDPVNDRYLAVDADGNIVSVIKGDFGGVLKTIAVDGDGIMKANLWVQNLDELITRPKYGAGRDDDFSVVVTASAVTDLVTIGGKGMTYGGILYLDAAASQGNSIVQIWIDGIQMTELSFNLLERRQMITQDAGALYITIHDGIKFMYSVYFTRGYTFETSYEIKYQEEHANTPLVEGTLNYALIGV